MDVDYTMDCDASPSQNPSLRGGFAYCSTQGASGALQFTVGIDFGTTASGITIGKGRSDGQAKSFTELKGAIRWPKKTRDVSNIGPKVLTCIAVSDHDRWGFLVSNNELSHKWFKLGLPHRDELQKDLVRTAELDDAQALRDDHDVRVSAVAEAYMRAIWHQCVEEIASAERMTSDQVLQTRMFVVIGAPANWGLGTLNSLLEAARNAGIPGRHYGSRVETCVEPEAAAIALLVYDTNLQKRLNLTTDDIFTVLDAGGGTSDAITFKIRSSTPMILDQYAAADARFCGPVHLEKLLFDRLTQKIKNQADPDRAATLTPADIRPIFHELWNIKTRGSFNGDPSQPDRWKVDVPVEMIQTVSEKVKVTRKMSRPLGNRTVVRFPRDELKELMDPTIEKIIDLVRVQFETIRKKAGRPPKALILCGGFGQNSYLRERLDQHIVDVDPAVTLAFASEPLAMQAVSKGCALRAVELRYLNADTQSELLARIGSRITGHSYGILHEDESTLRLFMEEGRALSATEPDLFELGLADFSRVPPNEEVSPPDFRHATASLQIYDYKIGDPICDMTWSDTGYKRLIAAFENRRLVQLGVVFSRSGIFFTAYVNGVMETQGVGFTMNYSMKGA